MAITVQITTTNYVVTATEVSQNITIIADSSTFTVTNQVSNFTITNVQPTITFTTDGTNGFDFAAKFRGEWVYGETYLRNDCVTYQENFYVCKILAATTFVSQIPPPSDPTNWTEVIDIRNITTASITDLTVANMTVTNTFKLGPLYYSNTAGQYGQVLFTDGSSYANWTNLGDLVFWSLSEDLKTNGFQILTNTSTNLKIKSGTSDQDYAYINIGVGTTNRNIYYWTPVNGTHYFYNNPGSNPATSAPLEISESKLDLKFRSLNNGSVINTEIIRVSNTATGLDAADPFPVGIGGIRFNDGTVMTTAGTGSFNISQIASASVLGVIRVGQFLLIDIDGVLRVDAASLRNSGGWYSLPAATTDIRGGIKIGNGLTTSGPQNDILNVSTTTEFGNVSLTQDMRTNGYGIRYSSAANSPRLDIQSSIITLGSSLGELTIAGSGVSITQTSTGRTIELSSMGHLDIETPSTGTVFVKTNLAKIGKDANTSTLHVQKIYNYAGSYAPEFPAGIQFGDGSVQVTAWQTSTLYQSALVVDFDNPFDP